MTNNSVVESAVKVLASGGVIAYPTDTLFGIGCDIFNSDAANKIFELKGRDYSKPLSVACSDLTMIKSITSLETEEEKILKDLLPGPYTFLVEKNHLVSDKITAGTKLVGIRIPDYPELLEIIGKFGSPVITTSANLTGTPDIQDLSELQMKVDFIVPGKCIHNEPSTLVDLKNRKIIRSGYGADKIRKYFALDV